MKVIVNGYVGKKMTGIGRTLLETVRHMAAIDPGTSFVIHTNNDNTEFFEVEWPSNVLVRSIPATRNSSLKNLLYSTFVFPFLALWERADVAYYPNFSLILLRTTPIVCVIHDMIEFRLPGKFSRLRMWYRHNIVPRMARISDAIVTVSRNSRDDIVAICGVPQGKIRIAYDAVSERFAVPVDPVPLVPEPYALYVGTVDFPGKNVHGVLHAFEAYKRKRPGDLRLVICGMKGKAFEEFERRMDSSPFREYILYRGYVKDDELFNYYHFARIALFLSYYEGFGMPALEAMKFGVPVIVSDRSSLPEVVGDAGSILDPDDHEAIADEIARLLEDEPYRRDLVSRQPANLARFTWPEAARVTLDAFRAAGSGC